MHAERPDSPEHSESAGSKAGVGGGGKGCEDELELGIFLPKGFLQVGDLMARPCLSCGWSCTVPPGARAAGPAGCVFRAHTSHAPKPSLRGGNLPFEVSQLSLSLTFQKGVALLFLSCSFFFFRIKYTLALFSTEPSSNLNADSEQARSPRCRGSPEAGHAAGPQNPVSTGVDTGIDVGHPTAPAPKEQGDPGLLGTAVSDSPPSLFKP